MRLPLLVLCLAFVVGCYCPNTSYQSKQPYNLDQFAYSIIDNTVVVKNGEDDTGTGITIVKGNDVYVLTCAHIFMNSPSIKVFNYSLKIFPEIVVKKYYIKKEETVMEVVVKAEMFRYSPEEDLAVLKLKNSINTGSTRFYSKNNWPDFGQTIYHIGHYKGERFAPYSFTSGYIAYPNRYLYGNVFDQTSLTIYSGSSGGGVFLSTGECIGLISIAARDGDNCNFVIPIRRIRDWAKKEGIGHLLQP